MNSNRNSKKGKRGFKKLITGAIAAALAIVLCVTMIPQDALAATADLDTSMRYEESLGDEYSTEYAGRIWSDKSVNTETLTYNGIPVSVDKTKGEEFLVTFSALSTSQSITGSTAAPLDVVFVIDMSGSMSTSMDNRQNRLYNATVALNNSMKELLALNDHVRVGVIGFNSTSYTLLPLDHYEQIGNSEFFTCSGTTITINAAGTQNTYNGTRVNSSQGTNIQKGIYEGLNMLLSNASTTVNINGTDVKRVPSVILLSDGQPSNASNYTTWWEIAADTEKMSPVGSRSVYGMKALMAASYMKDAVDRYYGVDTKVYSIGIGITDLGTNDRALAYATINPNDTTLKNSSNSLVTAIQSAWSTYANGGTPTLNSYTFTHPNTGYDIVPADKGIEGLYYVDAYYDADSASAVTDVFDSIVQDISISTPEVPTELKGSNPITDGYITYTDPLGEYMEVKSIKALVYNDTTFEWSDTRDEKTTSGSVTTYTFKPTDTVDTGVYEDQNVENIIIEVTQTDATHQTMVIKIPAALVPVRVNTVKLDKNSAVTSHTHNGMEPVRVIYSVGLAQVDPDGDGTYEDIIKNGVVDTSVLSTKYVDANLNKDGTVNFYSNLFTGKEIVHLHADEGITEHTATVGDTTVEFEPSHSNPFYYMQGDVPIYVDADGNTQASGTLVDTQTYYYRTEYYDGTAVKTEIIGRTGKQLKLTDVIEKGGYLYRAAGSPRLNRILEFEGTKTNNATNTAKDFYMPTFVDGTLTEDAYDGKYVIYLGNNGVVNYAADGILEISKSVVISEGFSGPDNQKFTFTVNFNGVNRLDGTFNYDVVNANNEVTGSGTIIDGGTLTLADGEKAIIYNLPHGTTYEVKEEAVLGFTTAVAVTDGGETNGTIEAGTTETIAFTNTYKATPVSVTSEMGFQGAKVLTGKDWSDTDSFRFIFESRRLDTPMPEAVEGVSELRVIENSHKALIVTVADKDAVKGQHVGFDFGDITYTKEGVYEYVISELVPSDKIHGVSYSAAMYTVKVTVTDNGQGKLEATLEMTKVLDDLGTTVNQTVGILGTAQGPEATFTNVFDAENEIWVPAGTKVYTDHSGANPITSGMFKFKVEALTSGAPLPADAEVGNVDSQVGYEAITFTKDHAGVSEAEAKTYVYRFTEVIPAGAVETSEGSNVWAYEGMYYDGRSYDVTVKVYLENGEVVVDATYPAYPADTHFPDTTPSRVVFVNTYDPSPATAVIEGQKTLNGREWLSTDSFSFVLEGADTASKAILNNTTATKTVAGAQTGATAPFAFDELTFDKPGTYTFNVTETAGTSIAGIAYDAHTCVVTVTVTDNHGKLEASVSYADGAKATFVNTYTTVETDPISIYGTKELTGRPIEAGEFFFEVEPLGNAPRAAAVPVPGDDTLEDGKYSSTVNILRNVVFTEAGTYEYLITEQTPESGVLHGVTYDKSEYRLTITVRDDYNDGKLKVTETSLEKKDASGNWIPATEVVFKNAYVPENATHAAPIVTKELTGRAWKDTDAFTFEMEVVGSADGITLPTPATAIATKDNADNVTFGDLTFTKPGEYTIKITEDNTNPISGITYSTNELVITYKVVDDLEGNLVARIVSATGDYTFTNAYNAEGKFRVLISKTFTGRTGEPWLSTDEFDFEVVVLDPDTNTALKNGDILFGDDNSNISNVKITASDTDKMELSPYITIKKAGTYKFVVREIDGGIAGVNYDSNPRQVVATATDNGDGTLAVTYTVDGVAYTESNPINFVNEYVPAVVELSGHQKLRVLKTFTGREGDSWIVDETDPTDPSKNDIFTFTLAPYKNGSLSINTEQAVTDGKVVLPTNTTLTITNANKAYAHFDNIKFTAAGTYYFEISETAGSRLGVTYDASDVIVKVVVTDNASVLEITSTTYHEIVNDQLEPLNAIEFNNTYSVSAVPTTIPVTKELVGREWTDNDKFEFTIVAANEETQAALDTSVASITTTDKKLTIEKGNLVGGKYTNSFGLTFTKVGTYEFYITETKGTDPKITYDSHGAYVTIEVTDLTNGTLNAAYATSVEGGLTFTNTYTPAPTEATLNGKKVLNGRLLAANEFHFRIDAVTAGAPMPAHVAVPNNANGDIAFGPIVYTDADAGNTYEYLITEIHSNIAGIEFDTSHIVASVEVIKNPTTGDLSTAVTYLNTNSSNFVFTNKYTTTPTDPVSITATKEVVPSDGNSYTMTGGEFEFEIIPADATDLSDPVNKLTSKRVTNDENGNVVFANDLKYEKEGTYVYTIKEVPGNLTGMTYDANSYEVTVTVTDDEAHAKLSASVAITKAGDPVDAIKFVNKYNPTEVGTFFDGKKELLGGHKDLVASEFEFALTAVTPDAPMPATAVVTHDATGSFSFGNITYTHAGVFEYTISEVKGSETGMTYDATVYPITVTVKDEGGQLKANVDGLRNVDNTAKVVFSNTYVPNPAYANISGTKVLEGRAQNADEFEFALLDSNLNVIATAKNTAEGKFTFKNVEFDKAGTYQYTIVERNTNVVGVTYDLVTIYGVTITVTDDAGNLEVTSVDYTLNGETAEVIFTNTYAAENPATIQLGAAKTLKGREMKAGEFTFLLTGSDGTALTAVNGADGSVLFDEIKYTTAGTYTYVITEAKGNVADVTYDGSKYTVTVVVKDDLKGNYVAEITSITESVAGKEIAANAVTFENAYTAPDPGTSPKTNDIFNIWMLLAVIAVAGFGFFGATAYSRRS